MGRGRVPAGALAAALAVCASALAACDGDRHRACPSSFDSAAWKRAGFGDRRVDLARELTRCDFLAGKDKAEVRDLLGPREGGSRYAWKYDTGEVNDVMGPGDAQVLIVSFTGLGRVKDVVATP